MPKSLLLRHKTEHQTAHALGHTARTLRNWRRLGIGPAYTKIGRKIFYSDSALESWLKAIETMPVRSGGRRDR
jgi:hypothetical protein